MFSLEERRFDSLRKIFKGSTSYINMRREEDNFGWHNIVAIGTTRGNQLNLSRKRREEAGEVCGANDWRWSKKHCT
ncbi:hypothetical protein CJ030_MR2G016373 [Morella rubra]|uniref:Uncharacterized protein n=1 Tax=Morella rubra TaxID=262757 RepID=A0A6A1WH02_9ROSI|nr:hypothetical protein CJ030_MR2G016373 [Morella rubra]